MTMIRLSKVSKSYPHHENLIENATMEVEEREVVVIAGPTGSGKTTLLRMMRGDLAPDGGSVYYDGRALDSLSSMSRRALKQVVALAEQVPILVENRTVRDNVALPLRLRGVRGAVLSERVDAVMKMLSLSPLASVPVEVLSTGERKLVSLARALVQNPRYLLLDEPLAGLDPRTAEVLLRRLDSLRKSEGFALVVATHDPMVVSRLRINKAYRLQDGNLARMRDPRVLFVFDGRLR